MRVETAHLAYPESARDKACVMLFDVFNSRSFTQVLFQHLLSVENRVMSKVRPAAWGIDVVDNNPAFASEVSTSHDVSFELSKKIPVARKKVEKPCVFHECTCNSPFRFSRSGL